MHQQGSRRSPGLSPESLRRRYLPRNPRQPKHPAAPPPAAAATAAHKAPTPPTHQQLKEETKTYPTTNWNPRLTPFKPGFEQETEQELAYAFKRPARKYKEDPPFYPWLPITTPIVNFHLNYKF